MRKLALGVFFPVSAVVCASLSACGNEVGSSAPPTIVVVLDGGGDDQGMGRPDASIDDCCDAESCGTHGSCVCDGRAPVCLCEAGYAGADCGSCALGYTRTDGRCLRSLDDLVPELAGEHCEHGGVAVRRGLDADGSGDLADGEVDSVSYICSAPLAGCVQDTCGAGGACVATATGPLCICSSAYAGATCESCAAGFVESSADGSCKLPTRIVQNELEPPGVSCESGGRVMLVGLDLDDDGMLGAEEVTERTYDCRVPTTLIGNVTVESQAALNELRGVTQIQGNLTVVARYLQDLAALESLSSVTGNLVIERSSSLESLSGLQALSEVGGALTISTNPLLSDISALSALRRVGAGLTVRLNPALASLAGLDALERVGGLLELSNTPELTDLTGLGSLTNVLGELRISNNEGLTSLTGLEALHAVGGALTISANPLLADLDELSRLVDVGGLTITDNDALASVDGLSSLRGVRGAFTVARNPVLVALDGFGALEGIDGSFAVRENAALVSMDGFGALRSAGTSFEVSSNGSLQRIDGFGSLWRLGAPCVPQATPAPLPYPYSYPYPYPFPSPSATECPPAGTATLRITDNPLLHDVDGFGALLEGRLDVEVRDNPELVRVVSLGAPSALARLLVMRNPVLAQLGGLGAVTDVSNSVRVEGTRLTAFDMPLLETVGGAFQIVDNTELTALDGFNALTTVNGELAIEGNTAVTSLAGFGDLDSVVGSLVLSDTAATTIAGFTELYRVHQTLVLTGHTQLDGSFFPALAHVDVSSSNRTLTVANNAMLSSLSFLDGVTAWVGNGFSNAVSTIALRDNPELASLAGLPPTRTLQVERCALITDLSTLSTPRSELNSLRLEGSFTSLTELAAFTAVNTLSIVDNDALVDLSTLTRAGGYSTLTIENNDALTSIATPSLTSVSTLTIRNNPALTSLAGLLHSAPYNATTVRIQGNDALTDLGSLPIRNISTELTIDDNDALVSLVGFPPDALTWNRLVVSNNDALTSLTTVAPDLSSLMVTDNPVLPSCLVTQYRALTGYPVLTDTGNDSDATCP